MGRIDDRIAQRRREVREGRRRARLRRTLTVAGLLVALVGVVVLERSPLVGLEEIRVTGAERLEEPRVRAATGLDLGTSTLRLRLGRVEERVAALPAVREVSARRLDPLTVLVEITEREPALVVTGPGGPVLVDREGVVMAEGRVEGLPRIRIDGRTPRPGARVAEEPALHNAFRVWRGLSGPLRTDVVRYEASGPEDVVLRLESGVAVRFGRATRVDEKVRALGAILEDVGDAEISAIDVRPPQRPFVVP